MEDRLGWYWLIKLAYVYCALAVSLFLTTCWEETLVGGLLGRPFGKETFLPTVLRAKVYTMLVVLAVASVKVIPQRWRSPDFLIGLGEQVRTGFEGWQAAGG